MSTSIAPEPPPPGTTPLSAEYDAQATSATPAPPVASSDVTQVTHGRGPGKGFGGFVTSVLETAAQPIVHPIDTAEGIIKAPIEAGAAARKYMRGQESGADALKAQLPVVGMLAFGPTEGAVEAGVARVLEPGAARLVGGVVAGAATGPMFNPDAPTVGAAVGALYGLLGSSVTGVREARAKAAVKVHVARIADAWDQIFSPSSRSPEALAGANILRATTGQGAAAYEIAAHQFDAFRRAIDPLPVADHLAFIDAIEGGRSQVTPEFDAMAKAMRATNEADWEAVHSLGPGHLDNYLKNYFSHNGAWEDPELAQTVFDARPSSMEGSAGFRKERTIPTIAEGVSLGLKLRTSNPVDLFLGSHRQVLKYLVAHQSLSQMRDAGIGVKYVPSFTEMPDGHAFIDDKIATVFGPRTGGVTLPKGAMTPGNAPVREMVPIRDEAGKLRRNLSNVADDHLLEEWRRLAELNNEEEGLHSSVQESGYRAAYEELPRTERLGARGQEDLPDADGTMDPDVLASHNKIIRGYNRSQIVRTARAKAMTRIEAEMTVRSTPGFQEAADAYHKGAPGMRPMLPSDVSVSGLRIMGRYAAPEPLATVINNYLKPGLTGKGWFDAYRGLGNTLNQAQLGFSAFHLMFTSLDATVSRNALGLEYLASGRPVEGLRKIVSAPLAAFPGLAQGLVGDYINRFAGTDIKMGLGAKIRDAYLHPTTAPAEYVALANALKEAGGRIKMDSFYRNSAAEKMITSWRAGGSGYAKAVGYSVPAIFEAVSAPILEHVVPLQKLGVFGEMAQKVLSELPEDATLADRRAALSKVWDSTDNRMGQLVYDNLFWNKTFKDLAMAGVRSVGWNIGTIRELGGGIGDLAGAARDLARGDHAELTHRAAYVLSLPVMIGIYNSIYQYLRTGEGPRELKDYYFPRTGETDSDGNAVRVQPPSYMKDYFAYTLHLLQTVTNKMSPLGSMVYEMLYKNQDFYGDEIRNPNDPAVKQIEQEASFMIKQMAPFSLRNMNEMMKRGDLGTVTKFGNWFGMTPAPRDIQRSDAQNQIDSYLSTRVSGATPEDVAARQSRSEILAGLRGNTSVHLDQAVGDAIERHHLTGADIERVLKRAGTTGLQERFKRLTLPQAMDVFDKSTPREKELFAEALLKKVETFETRDGGSQEPLPPGLDGSLGGEEPPPPVADATGETAQTDGISGTPTADTTAQPVAQTPPVADASAAQAPSATGSGELRVPAAGGTAKKKIDLKDADARKSSQALLAALRGNKDGSASGDITQAVTDAIEKHRLTKSSVVRLLKATANTSGTEQFKRLTLAQAVDVFRESTPEEKQKFGHALYDKIGRASDRGEAMPPILR